LKAFEDAARRSAIWRRKAEKLQNRGEVGFSLGELSLGLNEGVPSLKENQRGRFTKG